MDKKLSPGEITLNSLNASVVDALDNEGITLGSLAAKLREELEADKKEFFAFRGEVIDEKTVANWEVRQRARVDAHKLRGDYPPDRQEHLYPLGMPVQVSAIDPAEAQALREAARVYARALVGSTPAQIEDTSKSDPEDLGK
jgi:hypothetical protein